MKRFAACLVALLALFAFSPADAAYRITYDEGGTLSARGEGREHYTESAACRLFHRK
jgi:hypothetical protein